MIVYRPCQLGHIKLIAPQDHDRLVQAAYLRPENKHYITEHFSISAWRGNECIGAAGIVQLTDGNGLAWTLISKNVGKDFLTITRAVRNALDICPFPKVWMNTKVGSERACRWALKLGFKVLYPDADGQVVFVRERVSG